MVKNSPADAEDPLEKEMAIHSSILSCLKKPHRQKSLMCYSPWGGRVRHNLSTNQQQQQIMSSI